MSLRVIGGGSDGPLLVLLHGLGASADVWHGVAEHWPGRWLAPDLPGHGGSDPLRRYSFGAMAAAVAAELADEVGDQPVVVLGHSLGGVLALTMATGWFGVPVTSAIGLGIKVRWSAEELAKAAELAARPARTFAGRDEAVARALRVAGLSSPEFADSLVRKEDDGWRPAVDQAAFGVGAPDLPGLLAAARADVVLAAGEHDPMCPEAHLAELQAQHVILPGLGHNAHVEDPAAVARLLP
ncbi:alpha/beta fold hydrolase [Labedaea rhizosphaerae]|uniref:Pimeloyl-ACP methyl ester carboxylesterase n=1 Tax=Labedaea rhizosphaerae TaxID=598644 RepID=A0A4R6RQZ2_LABRH|nr:alpha/beta fold hydrolase [Labedaea rhizosphaerae]TDP89221.1 pimeloyl-ACP methyl ester carboxylesterase [Labedaea rhizosphaerae]